MLAWSGPYNVADAYPPDTGFMRASRCPSVTALFPKCPFHLFPVVAAKLKRE